MVDRMSIKEGWWIMLGFSCCVLVALFLFVLSCEFMFGKPDAE